MVRSFVFSQGKLVSQDIGMDFLKLMLYDEDAQLWADIESASPEETKSVLEGVFNFHPLAIEDCIAVSERPKVDEYEGYIFLVIHAVDFSHDQQEFCTTELNMFIGKNFLVTYHQAPLRSITTTIERVIKNAASIARAPDRLTYTILDFLLDNYDPAFEDLSSEIVALEKGITSDTSVDVLGKVLKLKGEVQRLRQTMAPQREVLARLGRGEFKVVRAHMLPYYRDLLDRLVRFNEQCDNLREALTNTLQVHLNVQQMQVNRVIKVLTVLATLSLPLVAITSYYGMNFHRFPELDVRYPHAYVAMLTLLSTGFVFVLLKWRKWL
ncbi:MAG: magnesium transporter CorA family protein [bacterium]